MKNLFKFLIVLLSTIMIAACTPTGGPSTTTVPPVGVCSFSSDALKNRAVSELQVFTNWLDDSKGFIGEVGWPNNESVECWNEVADTWYRQADQADLWITAWAAGEWWGPYNLAVYGTSGVAFPSAEVVEAHLGPLRGVNVNGGEFGIGQNLGIGTGGTFSNLNPGVYDSTYHYESQSSLDYLGARGIKVIRVPIRWERIQPTLGASLDIAELDRLKALITRAEQAGLQVIPTVMNYGAYWLDAGGVGHRTPIGSPQVTGAHFIDLWLRLSTSLKNVSNIKAWGLMNEPTHIPGGGMAWEQMSQSAVSAIRQSGDVRTIAVPGYNWSTVSRFQETHPAGPWIVDPARNVVYEGHHYFDDNNSGEYRSYSEELDIAIREGY